MCISGSQALQKHLRKFAVQAASLLVLCSCAKNGENPENILHSSAQALASHPCLRTAPFEELPDPQIAGVVRCKKEGIVFFYRRVQGSDQRQLSTINVNEPLAALPNFMNIYRPMAGATSKLGQPDRSEQNRRYRTLTYRLTDGMSVTFDVVNSGNIGHITFFWPAGKA